MAGQCAAATGYGGFLLVSGHGLGQGSLEVTPKKLEGKLAPWVGTLHPLRRHTTWVLCMLPDVHHGHAPGEASASPPTLASTTRRMNSSRPLLMSPNQGLHLSEPGVEESDGRFATSTATRRKKGATLPSRPLAPLHAIRPRSRLYVPCSVLIHSNI